MLMNILEQQMVVPVVDIDSNEDRTGHFKCFAQLLPNLIRGVDEQTFRAKGFRVLDNVDRTEIHARCPFVFGTLLDRNHVIGSVNPDHVDEVQLQSNSGLQLHARKQKSAVTQDRQRFLMWPHEARSNSPGQRYSKRLLPVADQNLAGSEAEQKVSNPQMEGAHIDADGHILGQPFLKFRNDSQRVYRILGVLIGILNSERAL